MEQIVFLNGEYLPASQAKISVFDRSVLFGDSIYEVIPVYNGQVFFLERHLRRLERSLASARISSPSINWHLLIDNLVIKNGGGDLQVYLQITRGNQGKRQHDIPKHLEPTVIAYTLHQPYPKLENQQHGLSARLLEDIRWLRCDIKTTSLLGNILLNDEAISLGANTAILIRDGYLTEGSASNVFIVDEYNNIRTAPKDNLCLAGIMRELTIEFIHSLGLTIFEEKISRETLLKAKEVWITSTTKEIYPITRIDDITVGNGTAGEYWQKINEHLQQMKIKND